MENKDQPAFPNFKDVMDSETYYPIGLTKKEHFASLAMQGLCANYLRENVTGWDAKTYAIEAVLLADALLNELSKT